MGQSVSLSVQETVNLHACCFLLIYAAKLLVFMPHDAGQYRRNDG